MSSKFSKWSDDVLNALKGVDGNKIKHAGTVAGAAATGGAVVSSLNGSDKARPIAKKKLVLPLNSGMVAFEKALFADVDNLKFIKIVLSADKLIPFDTWLFQLGAFADMVNDINQTADVKTYLGGFTDLVKAAIGTLTGDNGVDKPNVGLTLIFDPEDVLLPPSVWDTNSMSILSQLTYHVSMERIYKYANKYELSNDGSSLTIWY